MREKKASEASGGGLADCGALADHPNKGEEPMTILNEYHSP